MTAPRRCAIVFDENEQNYVNAAFALSLCVRDGESGRTRDESIRIIQRAPQHIVGKIAKKLFHANRVIGGKNA